MAAVLLKLPEKLHDKLRHVKAMTYEPINAQIVRAIEASLQPKKKARK